MTRERTDDVTDDVLVGELARLNAAILEKLAGLSEYDLRRPMTPTGTNLLGVVKHLASVQAGYFGNVFGRPWPDPMPWFEPNAPVNADLYATADESSAEIVEMYRRSWQHALATFAERSLEDTGIVPWWPDHRRHPTLRAVLAHMTVETARHAGHLDIVREMIDGAAGRFTGDASLPGADEIEWSDFVDTVEAAARAAANG